MRTFLRRLLIGWLIPLEWAICFPLFWLLIGREKSARVVAEISSFIWNGEREE